MQFSSMPNDQVCHCQEGGIRQSVDHRSAGAFLNGVLTTPAPRYSASWPVMKPLLKSGALLLRKLLRQGCEVMERSRP